MIICLNSSVVGREGISVVVGSVAGPVAGFASRSDLGCLVGQFGGFIVIGPPVVCVVESVVDPLIEFAAEAGCVFVFAGAATGVVGFEGSATRLVSLVLQMVLLVVSALWWELQVVLALSMTQDVVLALLVVLAQT